MHGKRRVNHLTAHQMTDALMTQATPRMGMFSWQITFFEMPKIGFVHRRARAGRNDGGIEALRHDVAKVMVVRHDKPAEYRRFRPPADKD